MNYIRSFIKYFVIQAVFTLTILSQYGCVYADVYMGIVDSGYEKLVITNISDITRRLLLKAGAVYESSGNIRNVHNSDYTDGFAPNVSVIENRYKLMPQLGSSTYSKGLYFNRAKSSVTHDEEEVSSGVKKFFTLEKKVPEDFINLYNGKYCVVYGKLSENFFEVSAATQLGNEFDEAIYPKLIQSFGEIYTPPEINKKIVLLCYDIDDDLNSSSYITSYRAGAFFAGDVSYSYANSSGNNAYLLHLDTYPSMGFDKNSLCSDVSGVYSTLAHEFQHMLSFSYSYKNTYPDVPLAEDLPDTWLSEVLAESAVYVYDGPQDYRVDDYNSSSVNGTSLLGFSGTLGDYSLAYLFGQYIRVQYGSSSVYGKILGRITANADYLEVICDILNEKNGSSLSKEDLIFNFNVALHAKEKTGEFGFMGEPSFAGIENKLQAVSSEEYVELAPLASWTHYISKLEDLKYIRNAVESNPFYKIASVKKSKYIYSESQSVSSLEISAGSDVNIPPVGYSDNSVMYSAKARDKFMNYIPAESCEFKMPGIKKGVSMSADGLLTVNSEADEGKITIEAYHRTSGVYAKKEISLYKSNSIAVNQEAVGFIKPSVNYAREGQVVQLSLTSPPGKLPVEDEVSVCFGAQIFKTNNLIFTMPGETVELKADFEELQDKIYEVLSDGGNFSFLKYLTPKNLKKEDFVENSFDKPVSYKTALYKTSDEYMLYVSPDVEYNLYDILIFETPFARLEVNSSKLSKMKECTGIFMLRNSEGFILYLLNGHEPLPPDSYSNTLDFLRVTLPVEYGGGDYLVFDETRGSIAAMQVYDDTGKFISFIPSGCGVFKFVKSYEQRQEEYDENIRDILKFSLQRGIIIGQEEQKLNLLHDFDLSMLCVILFRLSGENFSENQSFSSVEWYAPYISFAAKHGLINLSEFSPYDKVNYKTYVAVVRRFIDSFNLHNGGIKQLSFPNLTSFNQIYTGSDEDPLSRLEAMVLVKFFIESVLE